MILDAERGSTLVCRRYLEGQMSGSGGNMKEVGNFFVREHEARNGGFIFHARAWVTDIRA